MDNLVSDRNTCEFYSIDGYTYPEGFQHPADESIIFFPRVLYMFENVLKGRFDKPNVCLEIGVHYGGASVWFLEKMCNQSGSHLYLMDKVKLESNPILQNNLAPYNNWTYMEGESRDSFRGFNHNGETKEFLDFVYVDGEHIAPYVLEDAINSFYCLKIGGIICFDDYHYEKHLFPDRGCVPTAVDAFASCFRNELEEIQMDLEPGQPEQLKWFIKRPVGYIKQKLI